MYYSEKQSERKNEKRIERENEYGLCRDSIFKSLGL